MAAAVRAPVSRGRPTGHPTATVRRRRHPPPCRAAGPRDTPPRPSAGGATRPRARAAGPRDTPPRRRVGGATRPRARRPAGGVGGGGRVGVGWGGGMPGARHLPMPYGRRRRGCGALPPTPSPWGRGKCLALTPRRRAGGATRPRAARPAHGTPHRGGASAAPPPPCPQAGPRDTPPRPSAGGATRPRARRPAGGTHRGGAPAAPPAPVPARPAHGTPHRDCPPAAQKELSAAAGCDILYSPQRTHPQRGPFVPE